MSAKAKSTLNGSGPKQAGRSRRGLERMQVADIQRARMLSAMAEVASERGAVNVTVAHVVARSGVSRRTFYEHFHDREECFIAAFDDAIERIVVRVVPAYGQDTKWSERIRAALQALLSFLDEEPQLGCLVIVQALGAGQAVLERRRRIIERIVEAVDEGRAESRPRAEPPPLTAEGLVGAVLSVIHSRLIEQTHASLADLTNQLMSMLVLPYLGPSAARRELARPLPESRRAQTAGLSSLKDLEMRLTYRTVRVLLTIGSHPDASNRQVASEAEIQDQGQVSKLLRRLQDLGLVRNAGERVKGSPNAWQLTERGAAVRAAISAQASP